MFEAKIVLDSISNHGIRLTTLSLKYPRYIHQEFLTHRALSRNSASTRAIPTKKIADMVLTERIEPLFWGMNQPGMQAKSEELTGENLIKARQIWNELIEFNVQKSLELSYLGLHKQWAGRPLEPFMHMHTIVTATDWNNFFTLRDHEAAMPEIHELARQMKIAMENSTPVNREWHIPYITDEEQELDLETKLKISTARCARVSYVNHEGKKTTIEEDISLFQRLVGSEPRHASPVEHQARQLNIADHSGNFYGWEQYRKMLESGY